MAYAASETRNMDRALAAETAAKASEEARLVSVEPPPHPLEGGMIDVFGHD